MGFDIQMIVSQFSQDLIGEAGMTNIRHAISAVILAVPIGVSSAVPDKYGRVQHRVKSTPGPRAAADADRRETIGAHRVIVGSDATHRIAPQDNAVWVYVIPMHELVYQVGQVTFGGRHGPTSRHFVQHGACGEIDTMTGFGGD